MNWVISLIYKRCLVCPKRGFTLAKKPICKRCFDLMEREVNG